MLCNNPPFLERWRKYISIVLSEEHTLNVCYSKTQLFIKFWQGFRLGGKFWWGKNFYSRDVSCIFGYCYLVVKLNPPSLIISITHISLQLLQFYILNILYYPIEKHFKEGYIFSVFSSGSAFLSNVAGFESQKFYRLSSETMVKGGEGGVTNQSKE